MLDFRELQVFLIAAETENFSETGRMLQMSQPAVSGHIQSLEQRLDTRLFDRTGRNIKLNEIGEAFVPVVRNLLKEMQQAESFIASQRGRVIGKVTLGCSTAMGKYVLPGLMSRFLEHHPNVRMACHIGPRGRALEQLCSGEIDLAITSLRVPLREVNYRHFTNDVLLLIAPLNHPLAGRRQIAPHELLDYSLVVREPEAGTSITLNRELARFELSLDALPSRLTLGNSESIVQAVKAGAGPAFVSRMVAQAEIDKGQVVALTVSGLNLELPLYMARHTSFRATEAQNAFWEFAFAAQNEDLRQL